jgi:hypothetical protein
MSPSQDGVRVVRISYSGENKMIATLHGGPEDKASSLCPYAQTALFPSHPPPSLLTPFLPSDGGDGISGRGASSRWPGRSEMTSYYPSAAKPASLVQPWAQAWVCAEKLGEVHHALDKTWRALFAPAEI